ncbi:hypothetical protein V5O48_003931 [Marasmius crinis-equi]|uniref:Uncharacterized protein n=1 Tax=Marasmius crinis-equi TaxID=585013 RepID=A0ABR3FRI4_9AGAR
MSGRRDVNNAKHMMSSQPPLGNLPGLYWDVEKKRYFPLNAAAQSTAPSLSTTSESQASHKRKRNGASNQKIPSNSSATSEEDSESSFTAASSSKSSRNGSFAENPGRKWKRWDTARFELDPSERERARDRLTLLNMTKSHHTWKRTPAPPVIGNTITALNFSSDNQRIFVGDSLGWLYTYARVSPGDVNLDQESARDWIRWNGEYQVNLHPGGEVSSIHTSTNRCIATCFGPSTRICVERFDSDELPGNGEMGEETSPRGMILGAAKKGVYIPDIEYSSRRDMRMLETDSDVFCVASGTQNIVYLGCRNGGIKRFDLRSPSSQTHIEAGAGTGQGRSSVMYMSPLRHYPNEMVVGWMNGEVSPPSQSK